MIRRTRSGVPLRMRRRQTVYKTERLPGGDSVRLSRTSPPVQWTLLTGHYLAPPTMPTFSTMDSDTRDLAHRSSLSETQYNLRDDLFSPCIDPSFLLLLDGIVVGELPIETPSNAFVNPSFTSEQVDIPQNEIAQPQEIVSV